LVEPQNPIAAYVASLYACPATANAGGVKFTCRISHMCLVGQRGNQRLSQKIGFDRAAPISDCGADSIDRGDQWHLLRIKKWVAASRLADENGFPLSRE